MAENRQAEQRKLLFESVTAGEFPMGNPSIIEVSSDMGVHDVLAVLLKAGVTSAPVYHSYEESGSKLYVGFIDVRDLVASTLLENDAVEHPSGAAKLRRFFHLEEHHSEATAKECINLSEFNRYFSVPFDAPLSEAVEILSQGVHRVAVVDDSGQLVRVISQSAVLRFVSDRLDEFYPGVARSLVQEVGLASTDVAVVSEDTLAADAFSVMLKAGLSAVGVVDEDGSLIGCLSASDIRVMAGQASFHLLQQPVLEMVAAVRSDAATSRHHSKATPAVVKVAGWGTVRSVVTRLAVTGVHRLFVVTEGPGPHVPLGVVTLTDVLALLQRTERQLA